MNIDDPPTNMAPFKESSNSSHGMVYADWMDGVHIIYIYIYVHDIYIYIYICICMHILYMYNHKFVIILYCVVLPICMPHSEAVLKMNP